MQRRIWKQIHQTQNWASSHSTLSHKQCESSTWDVTYPSPVFAAWTHYGFPETWVGKDHKFVYFSPFLLLNSLLQYSHKMVIEWRVKLLCCVRLFATPWTVAHQAPPSMGFSRQEYWSGLPFPSPGDLPNPGFEPRSPALQADTLTSEPPGKPKWSLVLYIF